MTLYIIDTGVNSMLVIKIHKSTLLIAKEIEILARLNIIF